MGAGLELETRRLRLRPFTAEDAPDHLRLYRDPEVTRQLPGGPFDEEAAPVRSARALARFGGCWAEHGFGVWALIDKATGRLVGQCGLLPLAGSPDIEILYLLERDQWGRGLAAEAAGEILRHAFEDLSLPDRGGDPSGARGLPARHGEARDAPGGRSRRLRPPTRSATGISREAFLGRSSSG